MSINKQKVPKIRFEGFSDTWVNQTLDSLVDESIRWGFTGGPFGSDLKSEDYTDSGIRVIQLQNIGDGEFLNTHKIYVSEDKANDLISCNIYPNEILISKMGDPVARCCLVPQYHSRYVMCSDGIRLVVNKEKYNNFYVFQAINQTIFRKKAISVSTGSTRKRIGLSELRSLSLMIPKLEEQTQIGNFFQQLDKLIGLQTRAVESAETYKKAMLQKMFPQKGEKIPRVRFSGFSGDWEDKTIGDIADIKRGASPRPISDPKWFNDSSSIGWVRISDVTRSFRILEKTEQYLSEEGVKRSRLIKSGSIIMSICATIGKPVYTAFDVCIHDGFVVFDSLKIDEDYTLYFLQTIQEKWYQYGQPGTQVNLNSDIVSQEKIVYPSVDEQAQIGNFFQKLDQNIEAERQKLEKYQDMKKAMLQRMFV